MKYSFMSFSTPRLSLTEMLEVAKRYGYDGIEPRLDARELHCHGIEVSATANERQAIRDQVRKSGIELACLATSLKYNDPATTEDMIRQTHERIDLAGDLGVPVVRAFGGGIRDYLTREKTIEMMVRSLGQVADHAAERGVVICMETHDDWCNPADLATVLSQVNHPAIACNWDILHTVRVGLATIDGAFETLKPWIRHLHIHDGTLGEHKFVPIGTGAVDHRRAVELLMGAGYSGFLSGEWMKWEPYEIHLPRELATMKGYERDPA